MIFKSKANTLLFFKDKLKKSVVLPLVIIKRSSLTNHILLDSLINCVDDFAAESVIIRSSAYGEDGSTNSHAGEYLTISDVTGKENVKKAIIDVFASYNSEDIEDEVFVQPFIKKCDFSGVIFTKYPNTGADYYVINYVENSNTHSITSGEKAELKEYVLYRGSEYYDNKMKILIDAVKEIENIANSELLDIEFAVKNNIVYIFQVRALSINNLNTYYDIDLNEYCNELKEISNRRAILPGRFAFGIMADWNPAELIGIYPKPLTLSLYKCLITNFAWNVERESLGYKEMKDIPIMIDVFGIPYIDIVNSFYSFIPKELSDEISEKLVIKYLDLLSEHREWHDKIEFEIVLDCLYDSVNELQNRILNMGFSVDDSKKIILSLKKITNNMLENTHYINEKINKVRKIDGLRRDCIGCNDSNLEKIRKMVELIIEYGTIPFSGLARCAFVSTKIFKGFLKRKVISQDEYEIFMGNIYTISKKNIQDFFCIPFDEYMEKYGFLRPGMYDISSLRYDAMNPALFYKKNNCELKHNKINYSETFIDRINLELKNMDLAISGNDFLNFLSSAVKAREESKFLFSHALSDLLELIKEYANERNISVDDISYYTIDEILFDKVKASVSFERDTYSKGKRVHLSPLIMSEHEVFEYTVENIFPNYITTKDVSGVISDADITEDIEEKIILLSSADPGMDWIFSKNIKGLITAFGGANSHMAIRALEHGVASAIGVGMTVYNKLKKSKYVRLNCMSQYIEVIKLEDITVQSKN